MDYNEIRARFSFWFWKNRGTWAHRTTWHFFKWMSRVERRDVFRDGCGGRVPATELCRMYRQDCKSIGITATWDNAVVWYYEGKEGLKNEQM